MEAISATSCCLGATSWVDCPAAMCVLVLPTSAIPLNLPDVLTAAAAAAAIRY